MGASGERLAERARITAVAAGWLLSQKRPGEQLALAVEPARGGWSLIIRSGDFGVAASCGLFPDDDDIRGVLIGLLADARKQAELEERVRAARFG